MRKMNVFPSPAATFAASLLVVEAFSPCNIIAAINTEFARTSNSVWFGKSYLYFSILFINLSYTALSCTFVFKIFFHLLLDCGLVQWSLRLLLTLDCDQRVFMEREHWIQVIFGNCSQTLKNFYEDITAKLMIILFLKKIDKFYFQRRNLWSNVLYGWKRRSLLEYS